MSCDDSKRPTLNGQSAMPAVTPRRPAARNNRHGIKNGLQSFFTTGRFPKGASYVGRLCCGLRRAIEDAVYDQRGELTLLDRATIQSAVRHEGRALLAQRWLRLAPDLTIDQRLSLAKEIGAASDARDRCLRALKIDRDATQNVIDLLYSKTYEPDDGGLDSPQDAPAAEPDSKAASPANAADGATARQEGDDA